MAYGHTFADDVKPMWQNRSENFAIYMGTKVNSFQAFEFLFQQVAAESREELRPRGYQRTCDNAWALPAACVVTLCAAGLRRWFSPQSAQER